ncbi:glutaredoxin domain-containing protein [Pendulispora albinea]|uniref:Glutaredoxin n=1 Tax=Pendulispora albinea TaxID=2741071 RepID=A0ABZ2M476_9BACT
MALQVAGTLAGKPLLVPARIAPEALRQMSAFHADVIQEVERAIAVSPVVVVGMAQNPHVKRARKALTAAGITFKYLEYGSYFSGWKKRLAIKLWSGWPTFPQVFLRGTLLGGEDLTVAAIAEGRLSSKDSR